MSLEMTDINEDPETLVTELDDLLTRMREDPFIEVIPDNTFMIHILNSPPVEYKSVVETMERETGTGLLTIDSTKEQVRPSASA